jgi:coproporphyrinogen III oxidase-like Fe-S oxidoreductase
MLSLYIHIPFCLRKCNFCSFHVIPEDLADKDSIEIRKDVCLQRLIKENEQWKAQLPDTALRTIHIGG